MGVILCVHSPVMSDLSSWKNRLSLDNGPDSASQDTEPVLGALYRIK